MRKVDFSNFRPPRCLLKHIPFDTDPEAQDSFFHRIIRNEIFSQLKQNNHQFRALFGLGFDEENMNVSRSMVILQYAT